MKKFLPSLIFAFAVPLIITALLSLEANRLAPEFMNAQLFIFITLTVGLYMFLSITVGSIFFIRNSHNPTQPTKTARIKWALIPSLLMSALFFFTGLFFSKSSVSCLKPNLVAIMSNEPLNMITCINIKSLGLTKVISFTHPLFMGQMFASTFVFFVLCILLYWIATSKLIVRISE